jgi:serine/threonine protein kinase
MPIASAVDLADLLRRFHLLEPDALQQLPTLQARLAEPRALAGELIRRGWLTPYQVNQLFQGKGASLLLGSYVLLERLGEGGMGAVFRARNWKLGRLVALKLIKKERLANEAVLRRFQREIQVVARLSHPNVVLAYDADQHGETHFFTMEHVEGIDLARLVKEKGPLPVPQACEIIRQAALGLQHAHEHGLVHRDIKPANLLLANRDRTVKVLDLGVARLIAAAQEQPSTALTQEGTVMGTPDYIAPEQALDSHRADIRSDLYSLGCTFYYLLTGCVPFQGGTALEKLIRHQTQPAVAVTSLRRDVSPLIADIVHRLMAKRPEERFQTPAELADALADLSHATPAAVAVRPAVVEKQDTFADLALRDTVDDPSAGRQKQRAERKRRFLGGLMGAVFLVVVVLAFVVLLRSSSTLPVSNREPGASRTAPPGEEADAGSWQFEDAADLQVYPAADRVDVMVTPPPNGAIVLFDGKGLDAWVKARRPTESASWKLVEGDAMQARGGDIMTHEKFGGSFKLHVEFRVPHVPKASGQDRGNSGVYLQGRYEIQVLDSYGVKSTYNDCGGICGVAAPRVNACKAPTVWQSYDIDFTAPKCEDGKITELARMTVYQNAVKIHDNVKLGKNGRPIAGTTGGGLGGDPCMPGPIMLQDHGSPVQYRNIWLLRKE